ncbi:olfactory receptor 14C36-like [Passer domesticus]|uniref:olfactory receptor 14C36-like n=1 Tax=Passer domesticus TaxID=48849 RepID=UPI0030FF1A89
MSNSSSISHFLLLALADTRQLQLLHFCLLLGISLAALLGNGLIISAVACGHHLHTPMFFFLLNLALSDLGSICTTVPKAMHNSLWDTSTISYTGCAAQVFFFLFFISAELALLTIMCYDRYVSICKPLHYGTLLGSRACAHMAAAAWASAFLYSLLHTANTFSLPLCHGNALGQFFCEIPHILRLSCSNSSLRELGLIVFSICVTSGCFVFIVFSYVQIFRAVLRIPSEQGRHKAFSTCFPHLAVVSLFISTGTFAYLKPPSISSPSLDLSVSLLYSVVPPALNPLIYSLRNQELKGTLRKIMTLQLQQCLRFLSTASRGRLAAPRPLQEQVGTAPVWTSTDQYTPVQTSMEQYGPGALLSQAAILRQQLRRGCRMRTGGGGGQSQPRASPRAWPNCCPICDWWAPLAQWALVTPPEHTPFSHWLQRWCSTAHGLQATHTIGEAPPTTVQGEEPG